MKTIVMAALLLASANAAHAFDFTGDNIAELTLSGLQLPKIARVSMAEKHLRISARQVEADYIFRNDAETPVTTAVIFSLPDIEGPFVNTDAGDVNSENFFGLAISQDGKPVKPVLQQRVYSAGLDLTDKLKAAKVPLHPLSDATKVAVRGLKQSTIDEWVSLGLLIEDTSEAGEDGKKVYAPTWTVKSTYSFMVSFPPKGEVKIATRHFNSVGSSVAFGLSAEAGSDDDALALLKDRYCVSDDVIAAARTMQTDSPAYVASWSSYKLQGSSAWMPAIGTFTMTIEKSGPTALVSACGLDAKQTDSTTVEKKATDYVAEKDINVLFLDPAESP